MTFFDLYLYLVFFIIVLIICGCRLYPMIKKVKDHFAFTRTFESMQSYWGIWN